MRFSTLVLVCIFLGLDHPLAVNRPALSRTAQQPKVSAAQLFAPPIANETVKNSTALGEGQPVFGLVLFGLVLLIGSRALTKQKEHTIAATDSTYTHSQPAPGETAPIHAIGKETRRATESAA